MAASSFASPLLIKVKKEIVDDISATLVSFDASKYNQIRIGTKLLQSNQEGCLSDKKGKVDVTLHYPCSYMMMAQGESDDLFASPIFNDPAKLTVVDSPPSKIEIYGFGKGSYTVFIWGQ